MKSVTLYGTSIEASALGFGCSALLGDQTDAAALALLNTAFDCGIRYFDVAPAYGQGRAEGVLGAFAEHRRDQIVIATKFGIEPSLPAMARSSFVRKVGRTVMRAAPGLRRLVGRASSATLALGRFEPDSARQSIERSLRMLRTTHIDVLLLHECRPEDLAGSEGLLHLLQQLVQEGKIRAFGTGTSVEATRAIAEQYPEFNAVAQFASGVLSPGIEIVRCNGAVINHGSLGASHSALTRYLREHPDAARAWSAELGVDCADSAVVAGLMLSWAARANTRGPVLFSSRDPRKIRANTRLLEEQTFSAVQLDAFRKLARESAVTPD